MHLSASSKLIFNRKHMWKAMREQQSIESLTHTQTHSQTYGPRLQNNCKWQLKQSPSLRLRTTTSRRNAMARFCSVLCSDYVVTATSAAAHILWVYLQQYWSTHIYEKFKWPCHTQIYICIAYTNASAAK